MEIFQSAQKKYAFLGISSIQSVQLKHPINSRNTAFLIMFLTSVGLCFVYLLHVAHTFGEYLNCAYIMLALMSGSLGFITFIWKMIKLFEFINSLEKVYNERLMKSPTLKLIYTASNHRVEKWTEIIHFAMSKLLVFWVMILKFLFIYVSNEFSNDSFELPYPMWFPFSSKNYIGFAIAFILQYIMLMYMVYNAACVLSFGFGAYTFMMTLTEDIKISINNINDKIKIEADRLSIVEQFSDFIEINSSARQLIQDLSAIYQPIFLNNFTWTIFTISGTMLMIQIMINTIDLTTLTLLIVEVIISFGMNFSFCEIGERVTGAFHEIRGAIDELNWYMLPNELQQILPTIMINAQQPVALKCFGSISCARETFKKIINTGYSYFMVFRQYL